MEKIKKTIYFKKIVFSLLFLVIISSSLFFLSYFLIKSKIKEDIKNKKKYHIVLNTKYGHADEGFSEQAVVGVCNAFKISNKNCRGGHELFKDNTIGYGFPYTMEDPFLIRNYIDNFIKNDQANNFVLPGFTFNEFLCQFNQKYEKKQINLISIGTSFYLKNKNCNYLAENKWPKNLWQINFKEYYAGYHAALYSAVYALLHPEKFKDYNWSKKGKQIAFAALGGLWIPPIISYVLGFKYGIQKVNEIRQKFLKYQKNKIIDTELLFVKYQNIGGFSVSKMGDKVKAMSKNIYKNNKVSVIMNIAVSLSSSVHLAALESNEETNKKQHWVIGVDVDQGHILFKEPKDEPKIKNQILVSGILRIKKAVTEVIKNKISKQKIPKGPFIPGKSETENKHSEYSTIPDRFKKNKEVWNKIIDNNLENLNTLKNGLLVSKFDCLIISTMQSPSISKELKQFLNNSNSKIDEKDLLWKKMTKKC